VNHHEIAVNAIDSAIDTMLLPGAGDVDEARAETLVIAYFSINAIDPEEFNHYCERVRRIAVRTRQGDAI
jgi:hypothetical protein